MTQLGINTRWNIIKGGEAFFKVTKKLHNALHGKPEEINEEDYAVFWDTSRSNLSNSHFMGIYYLFIHDPQPIAFGKEERGGKREMGEVFKMVKRHFDCQLVLAGGFPSDDP